MKMCSLDWNDNYRDNNKNINNNTNYSILENITIIAESIMIRKITVWIVYIK